MIDTISYASQNLFLLAFGFWRVLILGPGPTYTKNDTSHANAVFTNNFYFSLKTVKASEKISISFANLQTFLCSA